MDDDTEQAIDFQDTLEGELFGPLRIIESTTTDNSGLRYR